MIIIRNIEVWERSKAKEFTNKIKSKAEDILFNIIEILPDKLIPEFLMNWMERYLEKRLAELKHEQVKGAWRQVELEQVVKEIRSEKK